MQTITLILSIIAVILAGAALGVSVQERRRNQNRFKIQRKSMIDYIKQENDALRKSMTDYIGQEITASKKEAAENTRNSFLRAVAALRNLSDRVKKQSERIHDLESGVIPDYDEAKKAVDAVNDINRGISGILGYDPLEARRKSRQEAD